MEALTREELMQRLRITPQELEEWTENELLLPLETGKTSIPLRQSRKGS